MQLPRWILTVIGILALLWGVWVIYQRYRPPYEQVAVEAGLLEIQEWKLDGKALVDWPHRLSLGKPVDLELVARPTRPFAHGRGLSGTAEGISLLLVEKAHPAQPVQGGGGILIEATPGNESSTTRPGTIIVSSQAPPNPAQPPRVPDQRRFRVYRGKLALPNYAGDYVLLVAVSPDLGTFTPDNVNEPGGLRIVRRIDISVAP